MLNNLGDNLSFTLTVTQPFDSHAIFVSAILDLLKHPNDVVISDTILRDGGFSMGIGDENRLTVREQDIDLNLTAITSLWNRRRLVKPYPPEDAEPVDLPFLESCAFSFSKSIHTLSEECFAVNSSSAILRASDKARQLRLAKRHGLRIPDTLISNDYERIAAFVRHHDRVCAKTFHNANWRTDEALLASFTAIVEADDLRDRRSIEIAPMIYQEFISKEFEVRVTVFGDYCCATRINSKRSNDDQMDWRMGKAFIYDLEDTTIPDDLLHRLKGVMHDLGIRFGTFDLAFNSEKGWVFFEVNESGQFLWQEEFSPTSLVLEPFARFLISEDENFTFNRAKASNELSMSSVLRRVRELRMYQRVCGMGLIPPGASDVYDERPTDAHRRGALLLDTSPRQREKSPSPSPS